MPGRLRTAAMSLVIAGSAIVGGSAATRAGAMPPVPPGECPALLPVAQVVEGMSATGWTVVRGDQPRPFHVEVLGVMPDAIAPGLPMILVEVSDLPGSTFIEDAGGIWAGMSGSPVYDDDTGRLLGAVAYGFTLAPSPIGGLTPASAMARVLDIRGVAARANPRARITLPGRLRREVARRIGRRVSPSAGVTRLPLPLVVSGLRPRMRNRLERTLELGGASYLVVPGGRARRPSAAPASRPIPGGNFAALVSYGDVTAGGIGTTSYVCGNAALAFGHPMQLMGRARYGANDADAIAIVRDSSFGSFKIASIGPLIGIVDQDRLAALRGNLTTTPDLIPITATVTSVDLGRTRYGRTDVTMTEFVAAIAPGHLLSDIDAVIDRVGGGSALLQFTVLGHRPDGTPWRLHRTERVASQGDISFEAAIALDELLFELGRNRFEDVVYDGITLRATVGDTFIASEVKDLRVSVNGSAFRAGDELVVSPGDELVLRVTLQRFRGAQELARIPLRVPRDASGLGVLVVAGGSSLPSGCELDPTTCPSTFPDLLKALRGAPRNDQIVASLLLLDDVGPVSSRSVRAQRRNVVAGGIELPVLIVP
jgi:hypothetical protein